MDRLQKKCVIVTTALHGLLVLIVLFGSALMPASHEETNVKLFTMYDTSKIVDDQPSSGGSPEVKVPATPNPPSKPVEPAPPTPPKTEPKPEPPVIKPPPQKVEPPKPREVEKPKEPEPVKEPKNKLTPDELMPIEPKKTTKPPKHEPKIDPDSLKPTTRHPEEKVNAAREAKEAAAAAQRAAERAARRQAAREFASALKSLGKNLSTKTLVDMTPGPGGGSEVSANYRDIIASKYYNAWIAPLGLEDDTPVVVAKVTIARTGEVVSARIITPSGNRLMDRSIEKVLETVTFIEPFPESSHDQERTVTIQFNLQAKRQIG
jgi:TonB family protein